MIRIQIAGRKPGKKSGSNLTFAFLYGPAAALILLGLAALLMPRLVVAVAAFVLISFGLLVGYGAWRLHRAKKQFDGVIKQMQSIVTVRTNQDRGFHSFEEELISDAETVSDSANDADRSNEKKIVIH